MSEEQEKTGEGQEKREREEQREAAHKFLAADLRQQKTSAVSEIIKTRAALWEQQRKQQLCADAIQQSQREVRRLEALLDQLAGSAKMIETVENELTPPKEPTP